MSDVPAAATHRDSALLLSPEQHDDVKPLPPPSVFDALRKSIAGATGSSPVHGADAVHATRRHAVERMEELLDEEAAGRASASGQCHAEALIAELEKGADPNELQPVDDGNKQVMSVLQAACTWWWTEGCDYDPRPVVAALLSHGADPHLRCAPMAVGMSFLRALPPARPSVMYAGHSSLWQTCALTYKSKDRETTHEPTQPAWSPADVWAVPAWNEANREEKMEICRKRRSRWDAIGARHFSPLLSSHPPDLRWCV